MAAAKHHDAQAKHRAVHRPIFGPSHERISDPAPGKRTVDPGAGNFSSETAIPLPCP